MFHRLAAVCGFVFVALIVAATVLVEDGAPLVEDSSAEIRTYVERDPELHRWAIAVAALAIPFAAVFFAGVVRSLAGSDSAHNEAWATVALIGALGLMAAAVVGDVLLSTLLFRGGDGIDDSTLRALQDGQLIAYAAMGPAIATLTLAVAIPSLWHRVWPAWHAILGLVAAAASVIAPFSALSVTDDTQVAAFFAFPALLIWVLATSVVMLRNPVFRAAGAVAAPPA